MLNATKEHSLKMTPKRMACMGDVHIGRSSSGFDDQTAVDAFERAVGLAISGGAVAILIAGDLFDSLPALYPNRAAVTRILQRAAERGVPVIAVAGNHDHDAIHEYARANPGLLRLIGRGSWEPLYLPDVTVIGRSFTSEQATNLLADYRHPGGDKPVVGLIHADIDAAMNTRYNPVALDSLTQNPADVWVLGHVHAPRFWTKPAALYTGSLQALDAGEIGMHGFRWLKLDKQSVIIEDIEPVSTVRYEYLTVEADTGRPLDEVVTEHIQVNGLTGTRLALRIHVRWKGGRPVATPPDFTDDALQWRVVSEEDIVERDLAADARVPDARGQAARLLLGLDAMGDAAWSASATMLVDSTAREIQNSKSRFGAFSGEEYAVLHRDPDRDREFATALVRGALTRIVTAKEGAA